MNNNIVSKESIQLLNASSSESDSLPDTHLTFVPPQPPVQVRRKVRTKRYFNFHALRSIRSCDADWFPPLENQGVILPRPNPHFCLAR